MIISLRFGIWRDNNDFSFIYFMEFFGFGGGRTAGAGQLAVTASEESLDRYACFVFFPRLYNQSVFCLKGLVLAVF